MHELGIMINVVQTVEKFAKEHQLNEIETLVLEIGELSSVIPRFAESCYPAAKDGTLLENTKLEIEILPGNAICRNCNKVFNYLAHKGKCPSCEGDDCEILGGKEFNIKEIVAC